MRNRVGLVLLLALVTGGLAAYLAFNFLRSPETEGDEEAAATREVVVAARSMDVGHVLTEEDVQLVEWPAASVPAGYAEASSEVVGRGLITPVRTNEPLLASKLSTMEAGGGMPIVIGEGQRGMSIAVNEVIGVAGYVLPGNRVDVLLTLDEGTSTISDAETQIILQDIEVLSSGQMIQRDNEGEPQTVSVVTLLVTPEQAERLALATQQGQIQLALRNPLDRDSIDTEGMRMANMMRRAAQPARASTAGTSPRPPSRLQVEIYRGPDRETATVDTTVGGGS